MMLLHDTVKNVELWKLCAKLRIFSITTFVFSPLCVKSTHAEIGIQHLSTLPCPFTSPWIPEPSLRRSTSEPRSCARRPTGRLNSFHSRVKSTAKPKPYYRMRAVFHWLRARAYNSGEKSSGSKIAPLLYLSGVIISAGPRDASA